MNRKFTAVLGASLSLFLAPSRAADTTPAQPEKSAPARSSATPADSSGAAERKDAVRADAKARGNGNGSVNAAVETFKQERERRLRNDRGSNSERRAAMDELRDEVRDIVAENKPKGEKVREDVNESARNAREQAREAARRLREEAGAGGGRGRDRD